MQKTLDGANILHQQRWTVFVNDAHFSTGLASSATKVTYTASKNDCVSPRSYRVTLRFNPDKPWYENISCKCNRTKAYGRSCYHASLCVVHRCITDTNAFVRDAHKFSYKLRCWHSPVYYVSTMILQYSAEVKIPLFFELILYALFPPGIMARAGKVQRYSYFPLIDSWNRALKHWIKVHNDPPRSANQYSPNAIMDNDHQVDAKYQYRFPFGDIVCYPLSEKKECRYKFDTKNDIWGISEV